jgi:putative ABC transport system ATP-binding protein
VNREVHASDFASVVKWHTVVQLVFEGEPEGIAVERSDHLGVIADEEECSYGIDQHGIGSFLAWTGRASRPRRQRTCHDGQPAPEAADEAVAREGATAVLAVDEVDLSVEEGALVAVMGPSGSGKSTLLTIAGALEEPTSGDVVVGGGRLSGMSANDRARLRRRSIGFVFQEFNLIAGLTAAENVAMPLELDGLAMRSARAAAIEALEQLGVADKAKRFPDDLSGGERQRVAIARAIVGDRHLLLADEPTGALDSVNGEAVMRLLRAACQRGVAGVVVTHDAQLAAWADRVVFLRDGRVVDQTKPAPGPDSLLATDSTA